MQVPHAQLSLDRRRHLAVFPEREIPRASYVREGRTLHLLDLENLCGGPDQIPAEKYTVADLYRTQAGIARDDHVVVGANPRSLIHCFDIFPGSRLVGRLGPDGADSALLDVLRDIDRVAQRYDRVIVGSGDHCFAPSTTALRARGILVGVVAREGSVSRSLVVSAAFVRVFCHTSSLQVVVN